VSSSVSRGKTVDEGEGKGSSESSWKGDVSSEATKFGTKHCDMAQSYK
jgi:hypothetical protein